MLIISNLIPKHSTTIHNYHKQFNSSALHYCAYHKHLIPMHTTMLIISNAVHTNAFITNLIGINCTSRLIIRYIIPMHSTTMLIVSNAMHTYDRDNKQCNAQRCLA